MKVLIATDGSADATIALRTAIRVLTPVDRHLDLMSVAPAYPHRRRGGRRRQDYERRILGEITQILSDARASVSPDSDGLNVVAEIGSPAGIIVDRAEAYDLTVIGPKGRGMTRDMGLGPVASRVVEHALGPVLVAREFRSDGGLRALIAVDGSTASLKAIDCFRSLFDLGSAEICLMHVRETPWIHLGLEEDWETYDDDEKQQSEAGVFEKELVREADVVLDQARARLHMERATVSTRVDEGKPADEILSEAERGQYDLVVLGATGIRDLKHSMLGSVSSKVAWNAPCSVLIVRDSE
jgi:nucleotide-binding universal stress UspA family protein